MNMNESLSKKFHITQFSTLIAAPEAFQMGACHYFCLIPHYSPLLRHGLMISLSPQISLLLFFLSLTHTLTLWDMPTHKQTTLYMHGSAFEMPFPSHLLHAGLWVASHVYLIMSATYDTHFIGWFTGWQFLLKPTQSYRMNGMKSKRKSAHGVTL